MGSQIGKIAAVALSLLLISCATAAVPVQDPREVWCAYSEPRRDATMETPRAELDEINAHNMKGELWCSWAAP